MGWDGMGLVWELLAMWEGVVKFVLICWWVSAMGEKSISFTVWEY